MLACALGALWIANSQLGPGIERWLSTSRFMFTPIGWINDVLMTAFFLVVGVEIKREMVTGTLSRWRSAAMPAFCALGGMLVPALICLAFNMRSFGRAGWGIPMATDVVLAVGVLTIVGKRLPGGAKAFLLTLAVADDLGGIVVIAIFYTTDIEAVWLVWTALMLSGWLALLRFRPQWYPASLMVVPVLWVFVRDAHVEPAIVGAVVGLLAPAAWIRSRPRPGREHALFLYAAVLVEFAILPLFAFANSGLRLTFGHLNLRVLIGVALGLTLGKPIGILVTSLTVRRLGIGELPEGTSAADLVGVGIIAGIGFTVALYIAHLAFRQPELTRSAQAGIVVGSVTAAVLGAAYFTSLRRGRIKVEQAQSLLVRESMGEGI